MRILILWIALKRSHTDILNKSDININMSKRDITIIKRPKTILNCHYMLNDFSLIFDS